MSDLNNSNSDSVVNDAVAEAMSFPTIDNTGVGGMKQVSRVVDFTEINRDLDLNPRDHDIYSIEKSGWMGRSLHQYGQQEPVLLSERDDKSLHLLRGFIRITGAGHVRTTGIPAVKGKTLAESLPEIPADPNFMSKVNALVIKGLSRQQEIDLVMDHGTKTGLTAQEKFKSALIMTRAGFSRSLIAAKLKMTISNYNNQIGRILNLPPVVQEHFLSDKKDAIKITQDVLKVLYPAFEADQKVQGSKIRVGGEGFNAAWEKVVAEGSVKRATVMKKEDITSVANTVTNPDLRDVLQAIRDNDGQGLASAINRVEGSIRLTTTTGTGLVRIEGNVETTVGDFSIVS